jgi:hypothetical protein
MQAAWQGEAAECSQCLGQGPWLRCGGWGWDGMLTHRWSRPGWGAARPSSG